MHFPRKGSENQTILSLEIVLESTFRFKKCSFNQTTFDIKNMNKTIQHICEDLWRQISKSGLINVGSLKKMQEPKKNFY